MIPERDIKSGHKEHTSGKEIQHLMDINVLYVCIQQAGSMITAVFLYQMLLKM